MCKTSGLGTTCITGQFFETDYDESHVSLGAHQFGAMATGLARSEITCPSAHTATIAIARVCPESLERFVICLFAHQAGQARRAHKLAAVIIVS